MAAQAMVLDILTLIPVVVVVALVLLVDRLSLAVLVQAVMEQQLLLQELQLLLQAVVEAVHLTIHRA
jgi:hypothetical protein